MKEFEITVTEKFETAVTAEAESADDALRRVRESWEAGERDVAGRRPVGVEYEVTGGRELAKELPKETVDALLVEPGQYPRMVTIGSDLKSLQDAVDGYIQVVYPYDDPVAIVCDEEGKLKGAPLNRAIRDEKGEITDIVAGPFLVCGLGEENFVSLPKEMAEKYEGVFHQPETFLKLASRILAIPTEPAKPQKSAEKAEKRAEPAI